MKKVQFYLLLATAFFATNNSFAQAAPDLYVKSILSVEPFRDTVRGLNRVKVKATIGNAGTVASGSTLIDFRIYTTPPNKPAAFYGLPAVGLPGISPRKDTLMELFFTDPNEYVTTATSRVQLVVDSRSSITESNETNNSLTIEITPIDPSRGVQLTEAYRQPSTLQVNSQLRALTAFSCEFNKQGNPNISNSLVMFEANPNYNLDKSNIKINGTSITVQKGGIYHLDVFFNTQTQTKNATTTNPTLLVSLIASSNSYPLILEIIPERTKGVGNVNFYLSKMVNLEVYLPAGTTISLRGIVGWGNNGLGPDNLIGNFYTGYMNGYLVQEF